MSSWSDQQENTFFRPSEASKLLTFSYTTLLSICAHPLFLPKAYIHSLYSQHLISHVQIENPWIHSFLKYSFKKHLLSTFLDLTCFWRWSKTNAGTTFKELKIWQNSVPMRVPTMSTGKICPKESRVANCLPWKCTRTSHRQIKETQSSLSREVIWGWKMRRYHPYQSITTGTVLITQTPPAFLVQPLCLLTC